MRWKWRVPGDEVGPLAATRTGRVFMATPLVLYALAGSDGKVLWSLPSDIPLSEYREGYRFSVPVVGPSGNLYLVMDNGAVRSYDADGNKRWATTLSGPYAPMDADTSWRMAARPVISTKGVLYVAACNSKVQAFDAGSGKQLWEHVMPSRPSDGLAEPVLVGDLLLVPLRWPPRLVALAVDTGKERWAADLSQNPYTIGGLAVDRDLAVVNVGFNIVGVRVNDGAVLWATQPDGEEDVIQRPMIGPDGVLLAAHAHNPTVGPYYNTLVRLTRDGTITLDRPIAADEKVRFKMLGPLGADGMLYVWLRNAVKPETVYPERLVAFSAHDDSIVTVAELPDPSLTHMPLLLPDGTLIYGTYPTGTTGTLAGPWVYAVQTQSAGLARGGWPRSGHDNQSSGDVATLP